MFGESAAILAGDALLNYAYETAFQAFELAQNEEELLRVARALKILGEKTGLYGMLGGQGVDVENDGKPLSRETLDFIYENKTSALIEASLMIGAVLALSLIHISQQTESRMKGSGDTGFSAGYYMVDFYFPFSFSLEKQVEALTKRCGFPETASVGVNWAYLGQDLEVGTVLGILGMMLMVGFAGYLLIYNVFYINVYADIRYYGLLKTVGTTTKQLKRMIRRQAYMLSAIGIPIGMLLGAVVGMVLLPVIMNHLTFAASTTSTCLLYTSLQ